MIQDLPTLLLRQAAAFDRLARKTQASLTVNQVHDLRVLTRRLRASVWVARKLDDSARLRKLRRLLRRVGRQLGERRMFDVALEDAQYFGFDTAPLQGPLEYAGAVARKSLKPKRRAVIVSLLRKASRLVKGASPRPLAKSLYVLRKRLQEALGNAHKGKAEQHELRIEAKKTRYIFEILGLPSEDLKRLQAMLGRAHDLEVLQELLGPHESAAREEEDACANARKIMKKVVETAVRHLDAQALLLRSAGKKIADAGHKTKARPATKHGSGRKR